MFLLLGPPTALQQGQNCDIYTCIRLYMSIGLKYINISKYWSTEMRKLDFENLHLCFWNWVKKLKIQNLWLYKSWSLIGFRTGPEEWRREYLVCHCKDRNVFVSLAPSPILYMIQWKKYQRSSRKKNYLVSFPVLLWNSGIFSWRDHLNYNKFFMF